MWLVTRTALEIVERRREGALDTATVDGITGQVLGVSESAQHTAGQFRIYTEYPGEVGNVERDLRFSGFTSGGFVFQTNEFGQYSTTLSGTVTSAPFSHRALGAPMGLVFTQRVTTPGAPIYACNTASDTSLNRSVTLTGGTQTISVPYNPTNFGRTAYLTQNWFQYLAGTLSSQFSGHAELPSDLRVTLHGGGGGQTMVCNGPAQTVMINFGTHGDDPSATPTARLYGIHEFTHAVQRCTEQVGSGCAPPAAVTPRTFFEDWPEGAAESEAMWFGEYLHRNVFRSYTRRARYYGHGVPNDAVLEARDLEGTTITTGPTGCDFETTGNYPCASNQACWLAAEDWPRCMRRVPSSAFTGVDPNDSGAMTEAARSWCATAFPGESDRIAAAFAGRAPITPTLTEVNVPICVTSEYETLNIWNHLFAQLLNTDGFSGGQRALHGTNMGRQYSWDFAVDTGGGTYRQAMEARGGRFEVSRAFHQISAESFPWADDVTDVKSHAELLRMPRPGPLTYRNSGLTGQPLTLGANADNDWFLLPTNTSDQYSIEAFSLSPAVNLCIEVWEFGTNLRLAYTPNCATDSTLNATANTWGSFNGVVAIRVYNATAGGSGNYELQVSNISGDDHPDGFLEAATVQPFAIGPNLEATGTLEPGDAADLFRLDYPPDSFLFAPTFELAGVAARMELFRTTGTNVPTSSSVPIATSTTGSLTSPQSSSGHYYIRVTPIDAEAGPFGPYTLTAQNGSPPGPVTEVGTYDAPRPLPTPTGGTVINELGEGIPDISPPANPDGECMAGVACDWYEIALSANERLSVATSRVFSPLCHLEVGVYGPPEWNAFEWAGNRFPVVYDWTNSLDSGAALSFVARRAGTFRIGVRARNTGGCPRYELTARRGSIDTDVPPTTH